MQDYRLYLLNNIDQIRSAKEFVAPNDDTAMAMIEKMRAGQPAELWQLNRLVVRVSPVEA